MFGLLKKLSVVGGLVGLLNTTQGRQLVQRAKTLATDPRTRQKATEFISRARGTTQ